MPVNQAMHCQVNRDERMTFRSRGEIFLCVVVPWSGWKRICYSAMNVSFSCSLEESLFSKARCGLLVCFFLQKILLEPMMPLSDVLNIVQK